MTGMNTVGVTFAMLLQMLNEICKLLPTWGICISRGTLACLVPTSLGYEIAH